ncbi:MAG: class I SAM-dependent methyltransferase [Chlorobiota bacterium]|nr:class I SAM-dependent methyltransferase [Chlorobiota bacterium]QQS66003.1 MAG: class I SAM-dependent methyltransferase [Chlorobiota bacterium]
MNEFWKYRFSDSIELVNTFDELPLWSAMFGLLFFKHFELKQYNRVLDIGSGTGFPLFELAERLGSNCKCFGIDLWKNANDRANKKILIYNLDNVEIIEGTGENLPFEDMSIDLIVSNLGINNFSNPQKVFNECKRVLNSGSNLVITTNLNGHWVEFYKVFEETLIELNKTNLISGLRLHQEHRGSLKSVSNLYSNNGFKLIRIIEDIVEMKFLNGSAFLNHHFIKLGWLGSWLELIPQKDWEMVFTSLENNLNSFADKNGGLTLTVPMAYIEGQKL